MLKHKFIASAAVLLLLAGMPVTAASSKRIDLVEFGRVVELPDEPVRVTTSADELARGTEGWEAVRSDGGQYTIGVEWDEPRELAEVNIEFRHAIANREQIKVQYWKSEPSDSPAQNDVRKPAEGRWMTPKTDWWAGDRDVSFSFLTEDDETAGKIEPGKPTRRTTRLRFICGRDDLPPVRYLRAYGVERAAMDTFDLRLAEGTRLVPPIAVSTVNCFVLAGDGRTTMTSAVMRERAISLQIRYSRTAADSPNRPKVVLGSIDDPQKQVSFDPAEVARQGQIQLSRAGLVVERRGGKIGNPAGSAQTRPSAGREADR